MPSRPRAIIGVGQSLCLIAVLCTTAPGVAFSAEVKTRELLDEIRRLHEQNLRNEQRIRELEETVRQIQAREEERDKAVEAKVEEASGSAVGRAFDKYFGQNRFLLTGWGSARYHWNDDENSNSFLATFAPIFLYRVNDSVLFESELEFELQDDGDTEVNLEYGQVDFLLNDYATLVAGKYLLPFGDFIERLHPGWINRLVTHPLPFREEGGVLPFSDVGAQLRGGMPLGYGLGTHAEYTVYLANGPRYESDELGAPFVTDNVDINRNKAVGARIEAYPLPFDWNVGWFEIGASTYDGKWDPEGEEWFTSWGVNGLYWYKDFQLRGEFVSTRRALQGPTNDSRNGWYVQGSYQLASVAPAPFDRFELVARYSVQNQVPGDDGGGDDQPEEGQSGAEDEFEFVPHPRQVALGLDYWITPSFVAKLEYDRDIPEDAENNDEIWLELALGF